MIPRQKIEEILEVDQKALVFRDDIRQRTNSLVDSAPSLVVTA